MQLCTSFTPAFLPSSPPAQLFTCLPPRCQCLGSFAWRPRATPSPLPTLCHLSGCTFRFNFVAIMHAKVQCFVGISFTLHPAPAPIPVPVPVLAHYPARWHFIACFIEALRLSRSHTHTLTPLHSVAATVKMKCAKCTLSTAFINILVLVGGNTIYLYYVQSRERVNLSKYTTEVHNMLCFVSYFFFLNISMTNPPTFVFILKKL